VEARGEVKKNKDETKQAGWYTEQEIGQLAKRTKQYLQGTVSEEDWKNSPGLETFWYNIWNEALKVS